MIIEILVKTINNDSCRYEVEDSLLVSDFKNLIQESTGVTSDRQRLIYRGQVLQDENALQHYRIESGNTVHMVARPLNATPSPSQPERPSEAADEGRNSFPGGAAAIGDPLLALLGPLGGAGPLGDLLAGARRGGESAAPTGTTQSLEHVRQSLLTVHSLRASMPPSVFMPPGFDIETEEEDPRSKTFYTGQWIDVKDTVNQWLEATVMRVDDVERKIFVHYNGWPTHWDEWIEFDSARISPFRTRTVHAGNTSFQCPTPNTSVTFAPTTGRDDIRRLLPGLLETHEALGTMLRQAAALAEQSLLEDPSVYDHTPSVVLNSSRTGGIAAGMPWDSLLPDPAIDGHALSADEATVESSSATQRFAELSQMMVPLMDRFGRILTDAAPHLDIEYSPPQPARAEIPSTEPRQNETSESARFQGAPSDIHPAVLGPSRAQWNVPLDRLVSEPTGFSHWPARQTAGQAPGVEPTPTPDSGLASLLASNLPPSLRQLLQPRAPSPPPERAYRQLINSPAQRGGGINHLVDIHIHAILTPSRPSGAPMQPVQSAQPSEQSEPRTYAADDHSTDAASAAAVSSNSRREADVDNQSNISPASSFQREEFSSDDDDDDSVDDSDSADSDGDRDGDDDTDILSTAVSAVSTLLASCSRENNSHSAESAGVAVAELFPSVSALQDVAPGRGAPDAMSIPNESFATSSLSSMAPLSSKQSPTSAAQHASRRRIENEYYVNRTKYDDLSEKERSTAHDLVEKYKSREKERRNQCTVPRLLTESLGASPQGSPTSTAAAARHIPEKNSGSHGLKKETSEFSPERIKPLKAPPQGLCSPQSRRPELQLTESLVSQSLEYHERIEMEKNVLAVQRNFERNSANSPQSSPRKGLKSSPSSPSGLERFSRGIEASARGSSDRRSFGGRSSNESSQHCDTGVPSDSSRAEHHSRSSAVREDSALQRRPSLISRLKRVVSFTDRSDGRDRGDNK